MSMTAEACVRPDKLMRIEVSSFCTFRCRFCCWKTWTAKRPFARLPKNAVRRLVRAACLTGCHNVNFTGGEPLLLPEGYLCRMVQEAASWKGVRQLWIATNGERLGDPALCRALREAGLKSLAISVAAAHDETYRAYTGTDVTLRQILSGMRTAQDCGLFVRVHVPLNPIGMASFDDLVALIDKLEETGVTTASYFRLHNGESIADTYDSLFVDPAEMTRRFQSAPGWRFDSGGRPFFTDGRIRVFMPRERIDLFTANCRAQRCGPYCQGVYAVYVVPGGSGWTLRACHRVFPDGRNEQAIASRLLSPDTPEEEAVFGLAELFWRAWRFAYEP